MKVSKKEYAKKVVTEIINIASSKGEKIDVSLKSSAECSINSHENQHYIGGQHESRQTKIQENSKVNQALVVTNVTNESEQVIDNCKINKTFKCTNDCHFPPAVALESSIAINTNTLISKLINNDEYDRSTNERIALGDSVSKKIIDITPVIPIINTNAVVSVSHFNERTDAKNEQEEEDMSIWSSKDLGMNIVTITTDSLKSKKTKQEKENKHRWKKASNFIQAGKQWLRLAKIKPENEDSRTISSFKVDNSTKIDQSKEGDEDRKNFDTKKRPPFLRSLSWMDQENIDSISTTLDYIDNLRANLENHVLLDHQAT